MPLRSPRSVVLLLTRSICRLYPPRSSLTRCGPNRRMYESDPVAFFRSFRWSPSPTKGLATASASPYCWVRCRTAEILSRSSSWVQSDRTPVAVGGMRLQGDVTSHSACRRIDWVVDPSVRKVLMDQADVVGFNNRWGIRMNFNEFPTLTVSVAVSSGVRLIPAGAVGFAESGSKENAPFQRVG